MAPQRAILTSPEEREGAHPQEAWASYLPGSPGRRGRAPTCSWARLPGLGGAEVASAGGPGRSLAPLEPAPGAAASCWSLPCLGVLHGVGSGFLGTPFWAHCGPRRLPGGGGTVPALRGDQMAQVGDPPAASLGPRAGNLLF